MKSSKAVRCFCLNVAVNWDIAKLSPWLGNFNRKRHGLSLMWFNWLARKENGLSNDNADNWLIIYRAINVWSMQLWMSDHCWMLCMLWCCHLSPCISYIFTRKVQRSCEQIVCCGTYAPSTWGTLVHHEQLSAPNSSGAATSLLFNVSPTFSLLTNLLTRAN